MLQNFRAGLGRYGKWLVMLIAIPFAFFGVESIFFSGAAVEEVASVDGERITRLELDQAVERQRAYLQRRFGEIDAGAIDESLLRGPALENLVATRALELHARDGGMGVAPQLIAKILGDAPMFQVDGKFSRDAYLVYLRQMGYSAPSHSRFLAREVLVNQLGRGVTQSAFVSGHEVTSALAALEETRDFAFVEIPRESLRTKIELQEEAVEAYYQEHSADYTSPEQVIVDYVELSRDAIAQGLEIDDAALQERYRERVQEADATATRIVAQIVVRSKGDGSEQDKLKRIETALASGSDFAVVAAAESEDPLTAENGGEIGPYAAENFPEALRAPVEALAVGEVSAPVETEQGWHLLKVTREDRARLGSFDEERAALRTELAQQQAAEEFGEALDRLTDVAYTAENLAEVAKAANLALQTSAPFAQSGGEGIGAEPKIVEAAFSDAVLRGSQLSPVIEIGEGRALVVALREHRPAKVRPLADVRSDVVAALLDAQAESLALKRAEELRKELADGAIMEKLAEQNELPIQTYQGVGRSAQQPDRPLVDAIFEVSARAALPAFRVLNLADRAVVYQVTGIHPGVPTEVSEQRKVELEGVLRDSIAARELSHYQDLVIAGVDVKMADPVPLPESR